MGDAEDDWKAEDDGFFTEMTNQTVTAPKSNRKRMREAVEEQRRAEQAAQKLLEQKNSMDPKASADEARKKIAARVQARANPSELRRAVQSMKQAKRLLVAVQAKLGESAGTANMAMESGEVAEATARSEKRHHVGTAGPVGRRRPGGHPGPHRDAGAHRAKWR